MLCQQHWIGWLTSIKSPWARNLFRCHRNSFPPQVISLFFCCWYDSLICLMDFVNLFPKTILTLVVNLPSTHEPNVPPPLSNVSPLQKSCAQALRGIYDIPISQLPHLIIKRDRPSIIIHEEEYLARLNECKNNLHGRVLWLKGSTPLTVAALRSKLS